MRLSFANPSTTLRASIERGIWYVFLATFAWQTRLILWQADRQFVEWRSMSLYASDILMLALFVFAVYEKVKPFWPKRFHLFIPWSDRVLLAFVLVAAVSVIHTNQLTVSVYQWVRLVQFVLLYLYVRYRAIHFDIDAGLLAFIIGAFAQSVLALGQYALQHDVGLRWLGETLLNTQMRGVAVFYDLAHIKILRAYGTLPHPNVLAVYLLTALWALAWLYIRHGTRELRHARWVWAAAGLPMLWALYLTYSRTMIAVGAVATLALGAYAFRTPAVRGRLWHIAIVAIVATVVFTGLFWSQIAARAAISTGEEAVQLRLYYARESLASGRAAWLTVNWTGIGIGNFTTWLQGADPGHPSWLYQPVHDLYLLVYSETGVIGVGLFLAWLVLIMRSAIRARRWEPVTVLGAFLLIALFDHFFWTLQQGRILFWLVAAYAAGVTHGT